MSAPEIIVATLLALGCLSLAGASGAIVFHAIMTRPGKPDPAGHHSHGPEVEMPVPADVQDALDRAKTREQAAVAAAYASGLKDGKAAAVTEVAQDTADIVTAVDALSPPATDPNA